MKKLAIYTTLLLLAACAGTKENISEEPAGINFSTENVVETFHYNTAWYMTYDDIDAGFDHEVIRLDEDTFGRIEQAIAESRQIEGELYKTTEYETSVFTLVTE